VSNVLQEIKITLHRGRPADQKEDENTEKAITNKGKLLTQIAKKNAMENILPILMQLKRTLELQRSPLLRDVIFYLRELLKDYRTELEG
jgi:condensin-2 complex subunit D3